MKCPRCEENMEMVEEFKEFSKGATMNDMINCFAKFHGFASPRLNLIKEWRCPYCFLHKREVVAV